MKIDVSFSDTRTVTVRKVWVSLTESCPYQRLFAGVYEHLRRQQPVPLRC